MYTKTRRNVPRAIYHLILHSRKHQGNLYHAKTQQIGCTGPCVLQPLRLPERTSQAHASLSNAVPVPAAPSFARLSCGMSTATERKGAVVGRRGCADPGAGAGADVVAWGLADGIVPVHHTSSAGAAPTRADSFCETTVATAHRDTTAGSSKSSSANPVRE